MNAAASAFHVSVSFVITEEDRPAPVPRNWPSAGAKSPEDSPCRYSSGSTSLTCGVLRAHGGRIAELNLSRANVVCKIRQRRGELAAPGAQVPDGADMSAEAAARRRELIGELAASGMSSRQIGERLGIGGDRVRQLAREHGIGIRADAVLGRTRRPDSARIVRETVHALEGLAMGVALADPAGLDPGEAAGWAASMDRSIRQLSKFVRQMKERI
jgi:hypothetical protein